MPSIPDLSPEFRFRTSRSGGPGGQHADKADTKVQLIFPLKASELLPSGMKHRAMRSLSRRLTKDGELIVERGQRRSQKANREEAVKAFYELLRSALRRPKRRKPTKKPRRAHEKRLEKKKERGEKKRLRKPPDH